MPLVQFTLVVCNAFCNITRLLQPTGSIMKSIFTVTASTVVPGLNKPGLLFAGLVSLAVILCSQPAQAADNTRLSSDTEPYELSVYNNETIPAELGRFQVPENRLNPASRLLTLSYVRLPALTDKPGQPIVYLSGGPGGSATGAAQLPRFALFQQLRQTADVILFDQRGTGLSDQVEDCQVDPRPLFMAPLTEQGLSQFYADVLPQCQQQWSAYDLDGYSTVQSAADLVALAGALGVSKLDFLAISYGTHLGMAIAKYHPHIVGKLVLASSEGLDQTIKLPAESERLLQQIEQRWQAEQQHQQSLITLMRTVHQQVAKTPVTVMVPHPQSRQPVPVIISELDLQLISSSVLLRNPDDQANLPAFYQTMAEGDFQQAAQITMQLKGSHSMLNPMALAMDAKSGVSAQRLQQVQQQAKDATLGRSTNLPFPDISQWLGVSELPDEFRAPFRSDLPALFLIAEQDGRTFAAEQQQNASQFSQSHSIMIQGAGHDSFMHEPEVIRRISHFLSNGTVDTDQIQLPLPPFASVSTKPSGN